MSLKIVRFIAVMLAALTLGMGFCHLMELPARMGWDQYLWVGATVQGGLYRTFGTFGALIDVAAIVALALNAYFTRERWLAPLPSRACLRGAVRGGAHAVVDRRVSGECGACEMGKWACAVRLGALARTLGMGARLQHAVAACGLCRTYLVGA